ncbi:MAG: 50S ribosomal protein L21 [Legionellales bacterium]|jgi:large subunit ribosomal protein L21|nr:50S ribosomal protein L21 [Legionellales bacterium]OUX64185.1 MAG: 50S ribosomal protein L21 [Gammaproteobacteria bacterium TMED281]|tara:strand:- start:409 stop:729 length:321 start_codon:yes stop_codon:yes gene_type:complete
MTKYALVETGGKQYKFEAGKTYKIEKIAAEVGAEVVFDKILSLHNEENADFGTPYIQKAKIKATIVEQFKDKKIKIIKFKRRKHHLKTQGHRQLLTKIKVNTIEVK